MHFHSWAQTSKTDCSGTVDGSANIHVKKKKKDRTSNDTPGMDIYKCKFFLLCLWAEHLALTLFASLDKDH